MVDRKGKKGFTQWHKNQFPGGNMTGYDWIEYACAYHTNLNMRIQDLKRAMPAFLDCVWKYF